MKVTGPGRTGSTPSTKKTGKSSQGGGPKFADALSPASSAAGAGPIKAAAPIASVDALLSLQEAPTATDGKSRGLARAEQMLTLLEDVRRGLLLGHIPLSKLKSLAEASRRQREQIADPVLHQLLDEIELRAEVELAKLGG